MHGDYYPPRYKADAFHCPYCQVYANQRWSNIYHHLAGFSALKDADSCHCTRCGKVSFWIDQTMIYPNETTAPYAHSDLPEDCLPDYNEARVIFSGSPKAAAALLRLVIQKLMKHLGASGENINNDIALLVKEGLPVEVQKALDYCRVIGNNAVHPGEISINDDPAIALNLFEMTNFIVENKISQRLKIEELYNKLPEKAREAINKRDSKDG